MLILYTSLKVLWLFAGFFTRIYSLLRLLGCALLQGHWCRAIGGRYRFGCRGGAFGFTRLQKLFILQRQDRINGGGFTRWQERRQYAGTHQHQQRQQRGVNINKGRGK